MVAIKAFSSDRTQSGGSQHFGDDNQIEFGYSDAAASLLGVHDGKSTGWPGGGQWFGHGGVGAPIRLRGVWAFPVEWDFGAGSEHIPSCRLIECPGFSS